MAKNTPSTQALAALKPKNDTGRQVAVGCGGCLLLFVGAIAALVTSTTLLATLVAKPLHAALSVILALVVCVPYAALFVWIDRNEKEPFLLLAGTFMWGAVMATGLSMVFNDAFSGVAATLVQNPAAAEQLTASLSAPFFEEITKALALGIIFVAFPRHFDNVLDGVVYGAMAGLGFATVENYLYYVGRTETVAELLQLFWIRGIVAGVGSHAIYTAITGVGFGAFRVLRRGFLRWLVLPVCLGGAMFVHFSWNTFTMFFLSSSASALENFAIRLPLATLILHIPFTLGIFTTAALALWHESKLIREFLKDESPQVVRPEDLERLLPARHRAAQSTKLLLSGKFAEFWRTRKRNALLARLAFEKWHMRSEAEHEDHDTAQQHAVTVLALRQQLAS